MDTSMRWSDLKVGDLVYTKLSVDELSYVTFSFVLESFNNLKLSSNENIHQTKCIRISHYDHLDNTDFVNIDDCELADIKTYSKTWSRSVIRNGKTIWDYYVLNNN